MELMRLTNSGTEATMMALAVSKVCTRRSKILVFAGAYHGGALSFAGSGGKGSEVNVGAPHEYLIATYNDLGSVRALLRRPEDRSDVAAIIVEPMMGSGGAIPASEEFLRGLREVANEVGAVLIFDEIMTSRMHRGGGIQSQLPMAMRPDLTTLGKYLGGGMSFGAFGGKKSIMDLFDPRRPDALAHAGTFNNNVLTMAAGRAGLEQVFTPERAAQLHEKGDVLRKRLQDVGQGTLLKVTGYGSIMCFHFISTPAEDIKSHKDLADADSTPAGLLHLFLLKRGYYIARRGFVALSLALSDADFDGFVQAVADFVWEYRHLLDNGHRSKL
ncbi:Beta-phenylalanine transaminase [Fulvia fulva]|nr:Beta-phenylalanine transaminase [Fulvia fulva]